MTPSLRIIALLLISAFFIACQPENPIVEDLVETEENDPMLGKWMIKRHALVIKGGAILSRDAGYIKLEKDGEGMALMTHEGSNHNSEHPIAWIYDEDMKTISIDHNDGQEATMYLIKDMGEASQIWQAPQQNEQGELVKITEILLQK